MSISSNRETCLEVKNLKKYFELKSGWFQKPNILKAVDDVSFSIAKGETMGLLGISVAFKMQAELFLTWQTLLILALGLLGFVFDTVGGVLFAKVLNLFSKKKVNPMIGAAGISAFPMASRVVHKMGLEEDSYNFLLMHAAGANVSGQIASVIAGGLLISLVEGLL